LQEQLNDEDAQNYANFIMDRRNVVEQEMLNQFFGRWNDLEILLWLPKANYRIPALKNMLTELF